MHTHTKPILLPDLHSNPLVTESENLYCSNSLKWTIHMNQNCIICGYSTNPRLSPDLCNQKQSSLNWKQCNVVSVMWWVVTIALISSGTAFTFLPCSLQHLSLTLQHLSNRKGKSLLCWMARSFHIIVNSCIFFPHFISWPHPQESKWCSWAPGAAAMHCSSSNFQLSLCPGPSMWLQLQCFFFHLSPPQVGCFSHPILVTLLPSTLLPEWCTSSPR